MKKPLLASKILNINGCFIIVVGILHLLSTPFLNKWVYSLLNPNLYSLISPAFLLDHVLVGILLIPLGILTVYAAKNLNRSEGWPLFVSRITGTTIMLLPIILIFFIKPAYLQAPLFLVSALLVTISGVSALIAAFIL